MMHWIAGGFLLAFVLQIRLVIGLPCGAVDTARGYLYPPEAGEATLLILKGIPAPLGMFPWVGFLSLISEDNIKCTISLIDEKTAITAAHCVQGKCVSKAFGVFGIVDVANLSAIKHTHAFRVKNFFYPKSFKKNADGSSAVNDVALLEFKKPIDIPSFNGTINTVCLPKPSDTLKEDFGLSGWGMTDKKEMAAATHLQYMWSELVPEEKCKEKTKFCVKGKEDGQTPFKGDSGGPAVKLKNGTYTLHGVLSGGNSQVAYYTRIRDYLKWIKKHKPEDTENPKCKQ